MQSQPDDDDVGEPAAEQDLLIKLRLSNRAIGRRDEREQVELLAQELEDALRAAGAGEYDGDELGGGECSLFFAGPSAEQMFAVLQPILHRHPLGRGAVALLQSADGEPVTRPV